MKKLIVISVLSALAACQSMGNGSSNRAEVTSPSQLIKVTVENSENKGIRYSVIYQDKPIIERAGFSLEFLKNGSFANNLKLTNIKVKEKSQQWQRVWGKSKDVIDHYREMTVSFVEISEPKRKLNLIFRAYDDGVALRYRIPKQENIKDFSIVSENTEFRFTDNHRVWATTWNNFYTHQEAAYNETTLQDLTDDKDKVIGTPLVVDLNNGAYAAILEANLTDWSGMTLQKTVQTQHSVSTRLSYHNRHNKDVKVISTAPRFSPWRVIMLGEKPGDLIESDLIHNLNEPNAIGDTAWIKPGKSAWDWWWSGKYAPDVDFELGANTETMKYFIDFAAEMGWEYQLVDWHWYGNPFLEVNGNKWGSNPHVDITKQNENIDIQELVAYASKKNVKLLLWLEWHHVEKQMDEAFPLYEKWGIAGVKIDFMAANDQQMVNFYHRVMKKAAQHHLVVDMHGAYQPTGISRTYPNFLTREGVMGNEHTKWSSKITPDHCLTLPFTRMLTGHMDFTPGGYLHRTKEQFKAVGGNAPAPQVMGTRAYQLAMMVVYESVLQVVSDTPYNYRGQSGLNLLQRVPTTWDETRVLHGEIGDYITIARRSGDEWYIGSMTDWNGRTLNIELDFLDNAKYQAHIWQDGKNANTNPSDLAEQKLIINKGDTITATLASGGGHIIHLKKL